MTPNLISNLYALQTIDRLRDTLSDGPLDLDSEKNWLTDKMQESISHISSTTKSKRKSTKRICEDVILRINELGGTILSSLHILRRQGSPNHIFIVKFSVLYRNTTGGALFGIEHFEFILDRKFRFLTFEKVNKKNHYFSKHSIERLYGRHEDDMNKFGTEIFSQFVNAQIIGASKKIIDSYESESEEKFLVPVDGGGFLCKRDGDDIVLTTFISDDMNHAEHHKFEEIPFATWSYQLASNDAMVMTVPRNDVFWGANYRCVSFSLWGASAEGFKQYQTAIMEN